MKTATIRKHTPSKFSRFTAGSMGYCGIHAKEKCGPPVVDYYTERFSHNQSRTPIPGRWLALCKKHAMQKGVTEEEIEAAINMREIIQ